MAAIPTAAAAQAVIAGTVKDSSGAVLPGVSIEAASPVLIEKVRTAVTDGTGQYRVEDLRPGSYTVTFTLPGFSTLKREGIELTGSFTATINAELTVGNLAETITVSGETPIVDIQSARRQLTLNNDVIRGIPTSRNFSALFVLVPGVLTSNNDVALGPVTTQNPLHGGRANESRLTIDGLTVGNPVGGNQPPNYVADVANSDEVTFTTSGGLGESETAGVVMNIVPKTGGNTLKGSIYFSGTGEALQASNFRQAQRDAGLTAPTPLSKVYDFNGSFGGPIRKDRVWYFLNARTQGNTRVIANVYYNLNAGDPTQWLYEPDLSRPEYTDRTWENASLRLTWQVSPRNKISAYWDEQSFCRRCTGMTSSSAGDPARVTPEAIGINATHPVRVSQVSWSSPTTSRWLLDAGFSSNFAGYGNRERKGNVTRDLIRVSEQCASGCAANGNIAGLVYRSQDWSDDFSRSTMWRASASYVTGAHSMKFGYTGTLLTDDQIWYTNNHNLTFRFNNGVPNQLTMSISPYIRDSRAAFEALFAQEQWTLGRLTLQGAVRFDRGRSWFPVQQEGPTRFLPTPIILPETTGVDSYKDVTPRMGVAYDVFGNGRTAVKVSIGKYLEGVGISGNYLNTNPSQRLPNTVSTFGPLGVTRTWTDANRNFNPDCNLHDPNAQDLRATGGDFCGQISNLRFGQNVLTNTYGPALLTGWGVRPSDWNVGVSLQQQILPRASIEVTYSRRWYHGFTVTDNMLVQPSDYSPFSVTAPSDPRLPGGGGYTISGLYDVSPARAGQIDNLITDSRGFGKWYQYFNGIDVTLNVRSRGITFQGGTSTGKTIADACEVRANLPELSASIGGGLMTSAISPTSPYCHVDYGVLTQFRGLAAYTIPRIDVQISGVIQSKPGPILAANYAVPNAAVIPSLGRSLSGNATNVTVNLIEPGAMYGDRLNQLDFRVAKILRWGERRAMVALDLYNALNSGAILTYNTAYVPGGPWLQPNSVLTARLARISAEFTF
jgi:hypothetical protein